MSSCDGAGDSGDDSGPYWSEGGDGVFEEFDGDISEYDEGSETESGEADHSGVLIVPVIEHAHFSSRFLPLFFFLLY